MKNSIQVPIYSNKVITTNCIVKLIRRGILATYNIIIPLRSQRLITVDFAYLVNKLPAGILKEYIFKAKHPYTRNHLLNIKAPKFINIVDITDKLM